jgi:hypothetical protein
MSRRSEDAAVMRALAELLSIKRSADEARTRALAQRTAALRRALDALAVPPAAEAEGPLSAAAKAGALQRWELWADRQRVALTADLARHRADEVAATETLRQSFGREEAARMIARQLRQSR